MKQAINFIEAKFNNDDLHMERTALNNPLPVGVIIELQNGIGGLFGVKIQQESYLGSAALIVRGRKCRQAMDDLYPILQTYTNFNLPGDWVNPIS